MFLKKMEGVSKMNQNYNHNKKQFIFIFLLIALLTINGWSMANNIDENTMNKPLTWLTYQKGLTKSQVENKPTLLYFYSDRCSWCNKLEEETFTNTKVKDYLIENFSLVRINSNSSEVFMEEGKQIKESELVQRYQVGGFPTIWFLDQNNQRIASLPGYVEAEIFINVLDYINGGHYTEHTFQEFMANKNA